MSHLEKLKQAKDRKELAVLLGYKPSTLTSIIYKTPLEQRYTIFEIPKKSGGTRTIKAPNPRLKKLQTHLAHLLYACLAEIEHGRKAKSVSYGFRKDTDITDNAKNHKGRRYILNLDLQDFFPTINFGRVRGFFLKDKAFELPNEVATTIAQIACDGSALPQGSPCSPVISELVGQILDLRLLRLSKKYGVRYSRYADDLTFSTNQKAFPAALAVQDSSELANWTLGEELTQKIEASGFKVNLGKTRMHIRGSRQMVTGLVVNEKVNMKSEYYRKARAMCDSLFHKGEYFSEPHYPDDEGKAKSPNMLQKFNVLEGILSHIYAVTQSEDQRDIKDQRAEPRAIRKLYRRFLFYKNCIDPIAPFIITEGKTDPLYLQQAIRKREKYFGILGCPFDKGFKFNVRFLKYAGQSHEIMDLSGGSGDLKSIPLDYLRNLYPGDKKKKNSDEKKKHRPFSHKPMKHPVILLLDNDEGLETVASALKKSFGVVINTKTTEDFYHITDNLYLIKTPEGKGHSCIEDLFPQSVREKELNGKKFNPKSKINPEMDYGKEIFARYVIKPNINEIDFSGFDPLLDRIVAILNHYVSQ